MADNQSTAIEQLVPVSELKSLLTDLIAAGLQLITDPEFLLQIILIVVATVPAVLFGSRLRELFRNRERHLQVPVLKRLLYAASVLSVPIIVYVTLVVFRIGLGSLDLPVAWLSGAIALMSAWILVRAVTLVIGSEFWSRAAFFTVWPIAVLDVFGMLGPVLEQLQAFSLPLGENEDGNPVQVSMLDIVRTLFYFVVLFWGARLASTLLQQQVDQIEDLSPTFKALLGKVLNILLPVIALLIAFQIAGFSIATLAVFSGAIGLGIGLGLQRVVANFIAGFALVADKSIKPDDVIEVDGVMGWVTSMQSRYVALRTRDGTELLVPNERLLTEGVTNWSRSDRVIRLHAPFGVSYSTEDLEEVQQIAVDAALSVERVVDEPPPRCNLAAFADSSVNFDLVFWIRDPEDGLANVTSDVLMNLWNGLKKSGIEIPFPQRDLHVKTWSEEAAQDA